jgi:hypothetical protein
VASQSRIRLVVSVLIVAAGCAGIGISSAPLSARATGTTSLVLQQMDSCKQALGGAAYQLTGGGVDIRASAPSQGKQRVASSSTCPLQQGDCVGTPVGCMTFSGIPVPGTYRIHEIRTPDADTSNPEGYAACNGGSACRSQAVDLTVGSSGNIQARVTNVYPDGTSASYPTASQHGGVSSYAGTAGDPVVVHNFGLAPPSSDLSLQCDGDGDADDHLTGSPSGHCGYPEAQEASACQPYPWSCTLGIEGGSSTSASTTRTRTSRTTSSRTTRSTSSVGNAPDADATFVNRVYRDLLGRPATAEEVVYWRGRLGGGMGRDAVGHAVLDASEFHGQVVDGDYQLLLGRNPDGSGRAFWTSVLDAGAHNEAVEAGFAASDEYYAVRGGGSPSGFVRALYRDFLGRTPSASEAGYWTGRIAEGTPRGGITGGFTFSHENHANLVGGWYQRYLGRSGEPGGIAYWSGYLDRGGRDETIEAGLIGAPEYLARPAP